MGVHVKLTPKEGEALMFPMAYIFDIPDRVPEEVDDPLAVLFAEGFSREEILACGPRIYQFAFDDYIEEPLSEVEKAILSVCVENTTWLQPYIDCQPELLGVAKKTLRDLAAKLETLGIEVNHIPND